MLVPGLQSAVVHCAADVSIHPGEQTGHLVSDMGPGVTSDVVTSFGPDLTADIVQVGVKGEGACT
jgi:hypothetical protein